MTMKTTALFSTGVQPTFYAKHVPAQKQEWIAVLLPDLHVILDNVLRFYWFCLLSHICPMYAYTCWIPLSSLNESTEKISWVSLGYRDRIYICNRRPFQLWWLLVGNKRIPLCLEELFSLAGSCHPEEVNFEHEFSFHSHSASQGFI